MVSWHGFGFEIDILDADYSSGHSNGCLMYGGNTHLLLILTVYII